MWWHVCTVAGQVESYTEVCPTASQLLKSLFHAPCFHLRDGRCAQGLQSARIVAMATTTEVELRDEHSAADREHVQTADLLGRVEDHRRSKPSGPSLSLPHEVQMANGDQTDEAAKAHNSFGIAELAEASITRQRRQASDQAHEVAKEHDSIAEASLSRRQKRQATGRLSVRPHHRVERKQTRRNSLSMEALADAAKISDMEEQLKNKPWYIINPESTGMNLWDIVTALALIFTALVTPFEVGFLPSATSPLEALFVINRLLDGDAAG